MISSRRPKMVSIHLKSSMIQNKTQPPAQAYS